MRLEDAIVIDCPTGPLYDVISDVENHAMLLPGYLESRIVEQVGDAYVLQREAYINGKLRRWKSEVRFEHERALHFKQVEGPFKGMRIDWNLEAEGNKTRFRIIHDLRIASWWKRWWLERMVAKPAIEKTARLVLEAFKQAAEVRMSLS